MPIGGVSVALYYLLNRYGKHFENFLSKIYNSITKWLWSHCKMRMTLPINWHRCMLIGIVIHIAVCTDNVGGNLRYTITKPKLFWSCIWTSKGQIILKGLFGVLKFSQKTKERICHSSKNEFVRSFLGEFEDTKSLRNYLTFNASVIFAPKCLMLICDFLIVSWPARLLRRFPKHQKLKIFYLEIQ